MFDKAGVGLSDPVPHVRTLEDRATEIEAVMDAIGSEEPPLIDRSDGGSAAIDVRGNTAGANAGMILYGTYSFRAASRKLWTVTRPSSGRASSRAGSSYMPSVEQIARLQEIGRAHPLQSSGGRPSASPSRRVRSSRPAGDVGADAREPGDGARVTRSDVSDRRAADPADDHRANPGRPCLRGPRRTRAVGRYLPDHIPGARYLEVDGVDCMPSFADPDTILTGIEEFLTGSHAAPSQSHRALRTVLFTDMVASTQHAAATGDEQSHTVLHRFGAIIAQPRATFRRHGDQEHQRRVSRRVRRAGAGHPLCRALALRPRRWHPGPRRHPQRRV